MVEPYKTSETVGAQAIKALDSEPNTHSAHDQMQEQLKDFEKNLLFAVARGRSIYPGSFFVEVITKKERLLQNVIRNYFLHRATCPTPQYDQTLYYFSKPNEQIQFVWTVPDVHTCREMRDDPQSVPPEEQQLLSYVLALWDGSLLRHAKKLNGESADTPLLIK